MEGFEGILPEAYSANFIRAIKDMGLLICGTPEHYNAMTVGWAQLGEPEDDAFLFRGRMPGSAFLLRESQRKGPR